MRRAIFVLVIVVALVAAAAMGAAAWVLYTPGGLAWAAGQLERASDGAITMRHESGTLGRGAVFSRVAYSEPPLEVHARQLRIRVSPASLLRLAPRLTQLHMAELRLHLPSGEEPAQPPQVPALPIALRVDDGRIGELALERAGKAAVLRDIAFSYAADAAAHRVPAARLNYDGFEIRLEGTIGTGAPYPVAARMDLRRIAGTPALTAHLAVGGSLKRLEARAAAESIGARLTAQAEITPGASQPVNRIDAALSDLDLRALEASLPQTALSGKLKLAPAGDMFQGEVALANALSAPYDGARIPLSALNAQIRTDFSRAALQELVVRLGTAGTLSGSARLSADEAALNLATDRLDLSGLHQRLQSTRLAGTVNALLSGERQTVTADLTQNEMRLQLSAARAGDSIELHEAVAHARGGVARASGELVLDGKQPFTATLAFEGFDPSAWGEFPPGTINGKLSARGTVDKPGASIDFALTESRLRDAPLSGSGHFSVTERRLHGADFELRLGANRLKARGAFGSGDETLRLALDAGRLATLDRRFSGRVRGKARVTGTLESPQLQFEASGEALAVENASIKRITASGTIAMDPKAPLKLAARGTDLVAAGRRVARFALRLDGSQVAHSAALQAADAEYDIETRVRGGWQPEQRAWSGKVLEFVNRGALDAALEAPAALTLAPDRLALGRFTVRVLDGALDVEEVRYQQGALSTRGRFRRLPVAKLAGIVQSPPPIGGSLRVSGSWSLVQDETLTGALTLERDSGDLAIGPDGGFPMQLQALTAKGRIEANRVVIQASLKSELASAEAEGAIGVVATDAGARITGRSPLRFTARLAVARISAFAPLIDANVLFNGALQAALQARGTLADPVVTGDITGERLGFASPPQGIDLRNGTLRAVLRERALQVQSFTIQGGDGRLELRGTLALNRGEQASLEWQAERLLLLGRPDRRLVVSGKGRAALADTKLSFAGGLRADEARFEIGPDALPEPGHDVIVAGRQPPAKNDSRLARTRLELVFNFGDEFHVRGRGLDARLAGEITVVTAAEGNLRAKGTVRTARGTYTAFGQRLEIKRGELVFSGPIDNPGLDILAMRTRQAVEAGVAVTGTLTSPLVRIVSDPPVPEGEAIAWLVLGHGTADASRGDLAMLPLAATSLLGKGDSPSLAQRFGLDTLGVRGVGTESQFLAVGKRIADRLYVGFEQGLGAAQSILKLEFDLTQRVLLRAETGESNAVGIFYRYSFD